MPKPRQQKNRALSDQPCFTTGEAAAICGVSQQTIIRSFDAGRLGGFRVPGSRFRRIPRDSLLQFMREHGIPTGALSTDAFVVLLIDCEEAWIRAWEDAAERDGRFALRVARNLLQAGRAMESAPPRAILLGDCVSPAEQAVVLDDVASAGDGSPPAVLRLGATSRAVSARDGVPQLPAADGPARALERLAAALTG